MDAALVKAVPKPSLNFRGETGNCDASGLEK